MVLYYIIIIYYIVYNEGKKHMQHLNLLPNHHPFSLSMANCIYFDRILDGILESGTPTPVSTRIITPQSFYKIKNKERLLLVRF